MPLIFYQAVYFDPKTVIASGKLNMAQNTYII